MADLDDVRNQRADKEAEISRLQSEISELEAAEDAIKREASAEAHALDKEARDRAAAGEPMEAMELSREADRVRRENETW